MAEDFNESLDQDRPKFFYHLGDVIYSFGEQTHYYDQFYEPYRNYPAPILAIPGNHDGVIYPGQKNPTTGQPVVSLESFRKNFCASEPGHLPEAGRLLRSTMTQPGVYFTLDAPFVSIIGLYSNVLEGPGVISSEGVSGSPITDVQVEYLKRQLTRLKNEKKAVLLAVHHPPYTAGGGHSGSPKMLKDIERAVQAAGFAPHAVISGHAHNYQRFTGNLAGKQIPFIVAGSGGHAVNPLRKEKNSGTIRTPLDLGKYRLEHYNDHEFGYLRVAATKDLVSFEFHTSSTVASKAAADVVNVDIHTGKPTTDRPFVSQEVRTTKLRKQEDAQKEVVKTRREAWKKHIES